MKLEDVKIRLLGISISNLESENNEETQCTCLMMGRVTNLTNY